MAAPQLTVDAGSIRTTSQLGEPTEYEQDQARELWAKGPPIGFIERFHGRPADRSYGCDVCEKKIGKAEIRHHCLTCEDFDACVSCYAKLGEDHIDHEFLDVDGSMISTIGAYFTPDHHNRAESAPTSSGSYPYSPLIAATQEVRVICLLAGSDDDRIQCLMAHIPLYAGLDFEALSYTWGDQKDPLTIDIDGCPISVGRNLFSALHALRYRSQSRFLWIDALCINQKNDPEKSLEVQRMRDIYRHAANVVVWLGEAADRSDEAMDLAASSKPNHIPQVAFHETDDRWSALDKLARRPWWSRVWCLQELAVPVWSPTIVCGSKSASWMQFHDTCRLLPLYWKQIGLSAGQNFAFPDRDLTFKQHSSIRGQYKPKSDFFLGYLLTTTLSWQAMDARDKIFGIVGLSCRGDREAIVPDYSLTTREVYKRTARYLAKQKLHCLSFGTNSNRSDIFGGQPLPSWVSDWSLGSRQQPTLWKQGCYGASCPIPGTESRLEPAVVETQDEDILCLGDNRSGLLETIRTIESLIRRCMESNNGPELDPDKYIDPNRGQMLWRTLIADKEYPQYSWTSPASPMFGKAYEVLRSEAWGQDSSANFSTTPDSHDATKGKEVTDEEPASEEEPSSVEDLSNLIARYIALVKYTLHSRRIFITEKGFFGIASGDISRGDIVVILAGGDMPFVLRDEDPKDKSEHGGLRLISESYVYGAMDGKLLKVLPRMKFSIM
ncbi:heterokaryon incompatibility protein [Sarocladium strictum]